MTQTRPFTTLALRHQLAVVLAHEDERVGLDGGDGTDGRPLPGLVQHLQVGGVPLRVVAGPEQPGASFSGAVRFLNCILYI